MGGEKQVFLLMHENAEVREHVVGAYSSQGVASQWQCSMLLKMARELATKEEAVQLEEIREWLLGGHFEDAERVFNALSRQKARQEKTSIVALDLLSDPPQIGVVRRGF